MRGDLGGGWEKADPLQPITSTCLPAGADTFIFDADPKIMNSEGCAIVCTLIDDINDLSVSAQHPQ